MATAKSTMLRGDEMEGQDQALWRALQPLRSCATFLMTGAHPDDEWNGFLGWLTYGRGVHTVYACATRGEGGQNALGPERGRRLAAIRSREMERAAAEIDLTLRWIGAGPAHGADDPIFDFGFSKSGEDTLRRWGAARLVERLVRVIRAECPDAVSPTFLDVPGQHGHHQAVTRSTVRAVELAADPGFVPEMPVWRVAKLYLPAFSGTGGSYDDQEAPPAETVRVDLGEHCAALGMSWAQLGERSRRFHASQGMGRDLPDGPRPLALHLLSGAVDVALPLDGVPHGLAELAGTMPEGDAARALREAGAAIEAALAGDEAAALHRALGALEGVSWPTPDIARRVALKQLQLARAAALALGIAAEVSVSPAEPRAGQRVQVAVRVTGPAVAEVRLFQPPEVAAGSLRDGFDPLGGSEPIGATVCWTHAGSPAVLQVDPAERIAFGAATDVFVTPQRVVRRSDSATPVELHLTGAALPPSWTVTPPEGRTDLPAAGACLRRLPGGAAVVEPASVGILCARIAIDPQARVGVIAGESDETLDWLRQLDISAEAVSSDDFSRFTTILVGVFGFGQCRVDRAKLTAWVEAGGALVTLYHRPGNGWEDGRTPPRFIRIGSPSLRWRVTDPAAPVTVLAPEHVLLNWPNPIAAPDWEDWVRERGLYFASAWDPAYEPLLALSDPGEAPLTGGLLAARVGRGRHVHVALALHHQFSALVPGAFRLLANLVASPR